RLLLKGTLTQWQFIGENRQTCRKYYGRWRVLRHSCHRSPTQSLRQPQSPRCARPSALIGMVVDEGNVGVSDSAGEVQKGAAMLRGFAFVLIGVLLGGCMQGTIEAASDANLTPRDRKLLANAPYAKASIPMAYQRTIVQYHRKEAPGTIVVDSDAHYLYY